MDAKQVQSILALMHSEISPALGCTEPAAVALACGKAREILGSIPIKGEIFISGNIFKNAMGVGIPGTGLTGLPIAAALGLTGGNSSDSLEILKNVDKNHLDLANQLIEKKVFCIRVKENVDKLYIEAQIESNTDKVTTIISHRHTHFTLIKRNNEILLDNPPIEQVENEQQAVEKFPLSIDTILKFIENVDVNDLSIFDKSIELNLSIAREGLKNDYGLRIGKNIANNRSRVNGEFEFAHDYALALTTAACDARMGGSVLPVMANTGSGNQGLTVSLPIIAYAEKFGLSHSILLKSLALGHLVSIHMKKKLGSLGALCGILVAATGASCGITYIRGGKREAIIRAIKYMAANITGMLCDGAKPGCTLKVHSGISAAIQASELALDNSIEALADGIVDEDIERTIENIANIGSVGLSSADKMIIEMMQNKC